MICGTLPSEIAPKVVSEAAKLRGAHYSAGVTLAVMGALIAGIVLLFWLAPK